MDDCLIKLFIRDQILGYYFPPDLPITYIQLLPKLKAVVKALHAIDVEIIQNLLFLFQALGRMFEEWNDLFDAYFHPVEVTELRLSPDNFIWKKSSETCIFRRINVLGFTDG